LNFHAVIGGIPFQRRANADSVVATGFQFVLEPQNEVRKFLFCEQVSASTPGTKNHSIGHAITFALFAGKGPTIKTLAIEERDKSRFGLSKSANRDKRKHNYYAQFVHAGKCRGASAN